MNASDRRALRRIALLDASRCKDGLLRFTEQFKVKRHKKPIQKVREAKEQKERLSKKGATAAIREACMQRSGGFCEDCRHVFDPALNPAEMDHWLGGCGRRRQKQTVENCWMLHRSCHRQRQAGIPNSAYWNERFRVHCMVYGYKFQGHIEHAQLPRAAP